MYSVAEYFVSINGEGTRAGELAVFIRFRGCNLHCSYCDTLWANSEDAADDHMSAKELAGMVSRTGIRNVTLTGGEPLLQKNICELINILSEEGCRVEIETNGSMCIKELAGSAHRPVFTMDYKLPSSGMEQYMLMENFEFLGEHDTVKFVSGSIEDLEKAAQIINEYSLLTKCHVYLSPVFGKIDPAEMVDFMLKRKLNGVRLQLQLHKYIWDPDKRGV